MDVDLRQKQTEFASCFQLTLEEYLKIVRACTASEVVSVLELMRTHKPKSSYRRYCQSKVRKWLSSAGVGKPVTPNDFKNLTPNYPIGWSLPR